MAWNPEGNTIKQKMKGKRRGLLCLWQINHRSHLSLFIPTKSNFKEHILLKGFAKTNNKMTYISEHTG